MSLWLRRRDLRTLLYIAIVIKFLATFEYIFIIFLLIFLLDFIVVTINLIQLLAAILIRINYLSIYLSIYLYSDLGFDCEKSLFCSKIRGRRQNIFRKFKVALNSTYRICLNFAKSCISSCLTKLYNKKKFHRAVF